MGSDADAASAGAVVGWFVKGEVIAVLAFPYAEDTAVPMDEIWPFIALVVDAKVPDTPAFVDASPPIL